MTVDKDGKRWWAQNVIVDPTSDRVKVVTEPTTKKTARGPLRAQGLRDTYKQVSPESAGCIASSAGYALSATREPF